MLNELITWILNTYLGKYLEDFNPDQLSVALISGEVELENVPIRKDALRSFGVPVQTLSGSIGRIKLQIPVRQFRTSPWSIVIERVYAVFGPKDLCNWDNEIEKEADYNYKIKVLDGLETNWRIDNGCHTDNFYSLSYSSWINYGTSLITNVLENLELRINDVHLRYEDTLNFPMSPIAAGFRIKSISAQSCDSNWIPCAKNLNSQEISFKLLELVELNIYWDKLTSDNMCSNLNSKDLLNTMNNKCAQECHEFIASPINATAKFKRELCKQALRTKNRPRIACEVVLPDINIYLSDIQYSEIIICVSGLQHIRKICEFRIIRPTLPISSGSKAWWQYLAKCNGLTYLTSEEKWRLAKENLRYISLCRRLLLNPSENIGKDDKIFKFDVEKNRSLKDLKMLRKICYESISVNEINLRNRGTFQGKGILYHWFPNWLGWYRSDENININSQTQIKDEEAYKNIENDILSALKETIENDSFSKRDAVFGNITFVLSTGRIYLLKTRCEKNVVFVSMDLENLFCFINVKPKLTSYSIGISLGSVSLKDNLTESTEFPYLMKPQDMDNQRNNLLNNQSLILLPLKQSECLNEQPWFHLEYEKNPSEHESDFTLVIKSKGIDIIYNESVFKLLISFFREKNKHHEQEKRKNEDKSHQFQFLKNWSNVILGQKDKQKKWFFEIDISAPRVICVENFKDKNGSLVLIDFGRFQLLKNDLLSCGEHITKSTMKENDSGDDLFMTPCSTPPGSQTSMTDSTAAFGETMLANDAHFPRIFININTGLEFQLCNEIYEKFIINLTDLQVFICKNTNYGCSKASSNFHLLDKFSITLHLERRIVNAMDKDYPIIKLNGNLSKIVAHVNEQKLSECLRIVSPIKLDFFKNAKNLENIDSESKDMYKEFQLSNTTFFQFVIGQIILEVQAATKSIAEIQVIGVKASITHKYSETHIIMSVHGFLLVDAIQSFGPDFELLVASHRHIKMDCVSGILKRSENSSPKSYASPEQDTFTNHRFINQSLMCTDSEEYSRTNKALISIDLQFINSSDGAKNLTLANIAFNNLDVIANQETIVELLGFGKRVVDNCRHHLNIKHDKPKTMSLVTGGLYSTTKLRPEINFDFHRLNILVLRRIRFDNLNICRKVGMLTMYETKISATFGTTINVTGALGGIKVIDATSDFSNHRLIFSVGKVESDDNHGMEEIDDEKEFDDEENGNAFIFNLDQREEPGYAIKIRMASVFYTHCPLFIDEIFLCVKEFFLDLKDFLISISTQASLMAMGLVQHVNTYSGVEKYSSFGENSFDIILNSPVLLLPKSDKSNEVLVANLGKITMCNIHETIIHSAVNEEVSHSLIRDSYLIDVKNINLYSIKTGKEEDIKISILSKKKEMYSHQKGFIPILHNTAVSFRCIYECKQRVLNSGLELNHAITIEGRVTQKLLISISRFQYEQLIDSVRYATNISILKESQTHHEMTSNIAEETTTPHSSKNIIVEFSVPILQMDLKNENNISFVYLTFEEFRIMKKIINERIELQVFLRSVLMEDLNCKTTSKFRNMVNSSCDIERLSQKVGNNASVSCPDISKLDCLYVLPTFLSVPHNLNALPENQQAVHGMPRFFKTKKSSHYNTKVTKETLVIYRYVEEKITTDNTLVTCSIDFNCLNLIISTDKWLMVLDFFGLLSNITDKEDILPGKHYQKDNRKFNREYDVSIRSLNLILVRDGSELAKANVSKFHLYLKKDILIQFVEGKLGSLSISDLTPFGCMYPQKFLTTGTEALSFTYKRLQNPHSYKRESIYSLEKDALLSIRMSSVQYIHTKRFLMEMQMFVKELLQLQPPVMNRLKINTTDNSTNQSKCSTKVGLDINAESPLILLPAAYNSNYVLIVDLGKFSIENNFQLSRKDDLVTNSYGETSQIPQTVDCMNIHLANMNLTSGERKTQSLLEKINDPKNTIPIGNLAVITHGETYFEERCHLNIEVGRIIDIDEHHNMPDIQINAKVSELKAALNIQQYKLLKALFNFNLGEDIDDVYYNYQTNLNKNLEILCSLAREPRPPNITPVWNILSINFILDNVTISLAESHFKENNCTKYSQSNLAYIKFIKSTLTIDKFSDGSQDIDLICREILVIDARKSDWKHSNSFKYILKPSVDAEKRNIVQIEIHSRKKNETLKYTILLNNMRIMALLDFINSLKNYLKEEPYMCFLTNSKRPNTQYFFKDRKTPNSASPEDILKFEFVLNITNSEIVFIENCEKFDSNAIILKSTTIFSYKPDSNFIPVSVDINHLEIFSCILGSESVSSLSIIDPFSLNMELRNDCLHVLIPNAVFLRISYNDAMLFSKIFKSFPYSAKKESMESFRECNFDKIAPLSAMGFNESECLTAMQLNKNNLNEAAIWLSRINKNRCSTSMKISSLTLNASSISICIIDDCLDADVPLLEFSLSRVLISHKVGKLSECNTSKYNEGEIETVISSNYYNRHLSGWEPIIETWECNCSWKYFWNFLEHNKKLNVAISSKQILKFNITSSLIELWELVRKNWVKEYFERSAESENLCNTQIRQRLPFVPFALENMTGEPLLFKIFYSQAGGITRTEVTQQDLISNWISANHGEIIPFDFGPQSKWRHSDSHKLNMHQILLQIHGWTLIGPISIDKVGIFFRYSNFDTEYSKKTRIVFEIKLVGSAQKKITVRSAVNILNHTKHTFMLYMTLRNENEKRIVSLHPAKHITVPLRYIDSLIYLKPHFESYTLHNINNIQTTDDDEKCTDVQESTGVCTKAISWMDCNTHDLTINTHSCFFPNKIPFHVLSVIKNDNFPTRDGGIMPGHTISILPPLQIKNLLCCDLLYKVSEHTHGRINSFDEIEIFSINVSEAFYLFISLDNYKLSGRLKIPMNHIGVVDQKLKLVDIQNRELSLRVSIQSAQGCGMEILISAPIWIINKTGLPLLFRQEGTSHPSSGQFEEHEHAREVSPLMFSFSDPEGSTMLEFRLGKSYGANNPWCKCVGLQKYTTFRELKAEKTSINYVVGVNVTRGKGFNASTTFITLSPRFQLYNRTTKKLQFAQKCDIKNEISKKHIITALPGCNFPFHWSNCEQEPLLCVRIDDDTYHYWSSGLPVNEAKSIFINLRNDLGEMFFLRLEVIINGGTYLLHFTDAYSLPPPIRVDNFSEVTIAFSQKGVEPLWRTSVKCQSSLAYVLDDPLGTQVLCVEAPGGNLIEFSLRSNTEPRSITYANFIYLAFKETFTIIKTDKNDEYEGVGAQQLVLAVKEKYVIVTKKCAGDRSQLWLMNSFGQIEHEGSSPPAEYSKNSQISPRLVLDLEKPPNPTKYTRLVVRPQNNQRITTQTWRFENGRLMCHANMCVQTRNGLSGLIDGCDAVLGKICESDDDLPIEQSIEIQKLRPGSGNLQISSKMDGPTKSIQIVDVKFNSDNIFLLDDPLWKHASIYNKTHVNKPEIYGLDEIMVNLELLKGLGLSLITRSPCEELAYITLEGIALEIALFRHSKSVDLKVFEIQIDNQLLETTCPIMFYTSKNEANVEYKDALKVNVKMLPSPNKNAVIFDYIIAYLKPCNIFLEERLILKMAMFLGYGHYLKKNPQKPEWHTYGVKDSPFSQKLRRFYFEKLLLGPTQVRLTVLTAPKLPTELLEIKKILGLTLIKLEDALIEFDKYKDRHHFETSEIYIKSIKNHYINQLKWHAASILGSVDFLGNPLGFANDLSEGVSGLIFEGSVKSLVKNVTHGISNSTAKLTETLSDSLGKVVLDEHDNETRQKILEISYPTTGNHLAAGLKGFGFGLLGGVTSIVRHTYVGTQSDGFPGFLSGLGKGLVGTVTKPLIGVLDLASETANAVRETSRGSRRCLPNRKRLPRCVTGAPGGLLPYFSYRQSRGQQYLYIINKRNFSEKLIFYEPNLCNDKETQLRLLISTEFVRIFSRCENDPAIMIECHLREILSCHPITTNTSNINPTKIAPCFYIEISTNLPKVTRPRIRCQNEEIAERASRFINYAKTIFEEREHTLVNN